MKKVRKFFKKLDVFGVPFHFLHKNKVNYSTPLGGLTFILFCIVVLIVAVYYFIPLFQRKNYSIVYYSMGMAETGKVELQKSNAALAFGFDCPFDKNLGLNIQDLLDMQFSYVIYTKDQEGNKKKKIEILSTHPCNYSDFFNSFNYSLDLVNVQDYFCLDKPDDTIEGIWNNELFTYYEFTVYSKGDSVNHYEKIDQYLISNDCKLQLFYIDITIDLNDYMNPIKPYLNSVFLQLDPSLFIKMNVFFMNQYFEDDNYLIYQYNDKKQLVRTLFSSSDKYSLYKGLNRGVTQPSDYNKYAKLYIRADTKKLNIKRKYQNLMECYADSSSLLIGVFKVLCFIFGFINSFYANISISKSLFFFKEIQGTNLDNLKKYKQIKTLITLTEPYAIKSSLNNFKSKEISKKEEKMKPLSPLAINEIEECIEKKETKIYKRSNFMKNEDNLEKGDSNSIKIYNRQMSSIRNYQNSNNLLNLKSKHNNFVKTKKKEFSENKPKETFKYSFNLVEIIVNKFFSFCCCMTKKMKLKKDLNSKVNNILYNKLDIISYIKNMTLLDIMSQTLNDPNIKDILKFLSMPIVSVNKNESINKKNNRYTDADFDTFYNQISELVKKTKKLKYEKKLISLSYQQLKELI